LSLDSRTVVWNPEAHFFPGVSFEGLLPINPPFSALPGVAGLKEGSLSWADPLHLCWYPPTTATTIVLARPSHGLDSGKSSYLSPANYLVSPYLSLSILPDEEARVQVTSLPVANHLDQAPSPHNVAQERRKSFSHLNEETLLHKVGWSSSKFGVTVIMGSRAPLPPLIFLNDAVIQSTNQKH